LTLADWIFHLFAAFGMPINEQWRVWQQELEYNVLIAPFWRKAGQPHLTAVNLCIRAILAFASVGLYFFPATNSSLPTGILAAMAGSLGLLDFALAQINLKLFQLYRSWKAMI
jgi:hypothetical protein